MLHFLYTLSLRSICEFDQTMSSSDPFLSSSFFWVKRCRTVAYRCTLFLYKYSIGAWSHVLFLFLFFFPFVGRPTLRKSIHVLEQSKKEFARKWEDQVTSYREKFREIEDRCSALGVRSLDEIDDLCIVRFSLKSIIAWLDRFRSDLAIVGNSFSVFLALPSSVHISEFLCLENYLRMWIHISLWIFPLFLFCFVILAI